MNFEEIFHTHKAKVFSLCVRYLQHQQEAEDAVQDIFVKVYQKQNTFKAEAQIGTWIYRISVNHCLDILKARKRKRQLLYIVSLLPFVHEGSINDKNIEDKESESSLQQKLLSLPERQLTALVLNKLEEIPIEKVATIMNISYKAVESLLQRGKQNLQKQLNPAKDKIV